MTFFIVFISSYVHSLNKVDGYMKNLVEGARLCLQEQIGHAEEIPLYLYATGGVRKLSDADQKHLLSAIRKSYSPFQIKAKTVLSGIIHCFFPIQGSRKRSLVFSQ